MAEKFYVNIALDDKRLYRHKTLAAAQLEAQRLATTLDVPVITFSPESCFERMPSFRPVFLSEPGLVENLQGHCPNSH